MFVLFHRLPLFIFYIYTSRRLLKIGSIFQKKFKNSAILSEFCSLNHVAHRKACIIFIMLFNYKDKIFTALIAEDADAKRRPRSLSFGVKDRFVPQGTVSELKQYCGMDAETIVREVSAALASEPIREREC